MRVLFVSRKFPPSVGGMEQFAYDLHRSVSEVVDTKLIKWGGKNIWLPLVLPVFFVRSLWVLLTNRIDVIHMQDGLLSVMGVVLKWLSRKPLVVVIHGLDVTFENPLFQAAVKFSLKRADSILCISQAAADEVTKRGIDPAKVSVITIGIDDPGKAIAKTKARKELSKQIEPQLAGKKVILSVGRLVKRKGVAWFIEHVMPLINDEDTTFVISGDGEDRAKIEAIISNKKLQSRVFLLGRTSDEVRDLLWYAADAFVMPNIRVAGDMEGFGIVLVEASSRGLPVVASALEGILDATKDGKNAIHVTPGDEHAFKKAVEHVMKDPESYAKRYRDFTLKHYSWPVIARQYKEAYKKLT